MVGWVVVRVSEGERAEQWRAVHNEVIPTAPLPLEEVLDRARTHVLEVALVDGVLVGCSTVRSATDEEPVTVIVRVLPAYRRKGLGTRYLAHAMTTARGLGAQRVQTIVLESNADGLAFAQRRGFVETERYVLDGDTVAYVHLERAVEDGAAG